jgi:hypothetical protein
MSLSQKNLSNIQKAGQAVHSASSAIAATVSTQAQSMVSSVASQPFGVESEQAIAKFKMLARLSQGLAAVEIQLQELYSVAMELANPVSDVIVLPSIAKQKVTNANAVDVVAKPAKAIKVKKSGRKAIKLTANDNKLMSYLSSILSDGNALALTGSAMSAGSGLPLGSVGVSLKKVITTGAVNQVSRGTYQLGTTPTIVAAEPVAKGSATKRVESANTAKAKLNMNPKSSVRLVAKSSPRSAATATAVEAVNVAPM